MKFTCPTTQRRENLLRQQPKLPGRRPPVKRMQLQIKIQATFHSNQRQLCFAEQNQFSEFVLFSIFVSSREIVTILIAFAPIVNMAQPPTQL